MVRLLFLAFLLHPPLLFSNPGGTPPGTHASSERIYQFISTTAQFLKWNDPRDHSDVIVSVLNDDDVAKVLTVRSRQTGVQRRKFSYRTFDFDHLDGVHIVYAGAIDRETRLRLEQAAAVHRFVLVTSDSYLFNGPHIRLLLDNARVRWEINEDGFSTHGIELNAALRRMAQRPALVSTR